MEASTSKRKQPMKGKDKSSYKHEPPSKKKRETGRRRPITGKNAQIPQGLEAKVRTLKGYQKRIEDLSKEAKWSTATGQEKLLETLKKQKAHLQVQVQPIKKNLLINAMKIKRLKEKLGHLGEMNRATLTNKRYNEVKEKLFRAKCEYSSKMVLYKYVSKRIETQEKDVEVIVNLRAEREKSHHDLVEQIAAEEQQCHELSERIQEVGCNHGASYKLQLSLRSDIEWHNKQLQSVSERVVSLQDEINSLQGNYYSCNTEEELASLRKEIESGVKSQAFKKTPLGPVGKYVAFKEDFWAPAITNYLSSLLSCFCVDNWSDYSLLLGILNKVFGTRPKPTIIISDFYDTVHDVSEHAVRPPEGMCSMLDVLSIDNPVIANCLIDKMEVERMLLVRSSQEARELMNSSVLPKNIKAALTSQGVEIYPANAKVLRVHSSEKIQEKEVELEGFERYQLCLEAERTILSEALQEANVNVTKFNQVRKALQETWINKKSLVSELKNSLLDHPTSSVQAEHREALEELTVLTTERDEILAECRLCLDTIIQGKKDVVALREIVPIFLPDKALVTSEKRQLNKELKTLESEKKRLSQSLLGLTSQMKSTEIKIAKQHIVTNQALFHARKSSKHRLISKRNIQELCHEKQVLEKLVATLTKK